MTSETNGLEKQDVRWTVVVLAVCQALFMCITTMAIATTPLAAHSLLGIDKTFATLPLFIYHAGIMVTTVPASLLMAQIGRRAGFSIGAFLSILSGLISTVAILQGSFFWLSVGSGLMGASAAFAWYYRFAAADSADESFRPKAISLVMAGGVVAGLVGPQTAKYAVEWFAPVMFAGVYVLATAYSMLALVAVQGVRIPRPTRKERAASGRPMSEIIRQPTYVVAVISSMFGYGVMTLIMSATPLAMLACGFQFNASATVIQAHVVAMFLPSFFSGHLIAKFGTLPIIATGAIIQIGCALINLTGIEFMNFFLANILVGLGWNFCYVGGSNLLTQTYEPTERAKVQASHDFIVYATTATAAGLSGILLANVGWTVVNLAALPMMAIVLIAAIWLHRRRPRAHTTAAA
ncbi:MAG: MFS transporter [Hyphomicrobiaceae bacterium]